MKLCYLHLSDLQLRANPGKTGDIVTRSMLDAIKDLVAREKLIDFIIISGDIASSGKEEEYKEAESFCEKLLTVTGLPAQRLFIVPGNHDINRREKISDIDIERLYSFENQDDITKLLTDSFYLPKLLRKFTAFNAFAEKAMGRRLFTDTTYRFVETMDIDKQGQSIKINMVGLNSALFTGYSIDGKEEPALGLYQVENALAALDENAHFSIAFFHHPFSIFHPVDEVSKELLVRKTDMIMTGHTHTPIAAFSAGTKGKAVVIGNLMDEPSHRTPNSFNLVEIDLIKSKTTVQFYKYLPEHEQWRKNTEVNPDSEDGRFYFTFKSKRKIALPPSEQKSFYLTGVRLENIQGFESLSAGFISEKNNTPLFTLLLGDNSTGKTSFLRCLILGICDEPNASALLADFHGKFIRDGQRTGTIDIRLNAPGIGQYRIVTRFDRMNGSEQVRKEYFYISDSGEVELILPGNFPRHLLFVCGYGAGRILSELRKQPEQYRVIEAVETLFRYDQPLQGPELSLSLLALEARSRAPKDREREAEQEILYLVYKLIERLFLFTGKEHIELTGRGIELVNAGGRSRLQDQGDGYKNTAAWALDLIAWNMLDDRQLDPNLISGIVLVDEIEQHLHPRWQRYIIQLLKEQFPGIQFIAATHSPMCVAGITDLDDDEYQVLRFHKIPNEPVELVPIFSLRGLRADQILTSEAFELPTTRNPETAEKLERLGTLYLKGSRTQQEEEEFKGLGELLEKTLPGAAEDAETRLMQQRLEKMLKNLEQLTTPKNEHD
ncbi:MAG: AAA family ATPase [Candidatus Aminicenantes bacterium]|nr:AAA family ATPase [Candidatus Aminicenantes bacterium]